MQQRKQGSCTPGRTEAKTVCNKEEAWRLARRMAESLREQGRSQNSMDGWIGSSYHLEFNIWRRQAVIMPMHGCGRVSNAGRMTHGRGSKREPNTSTERCGSSA